MAISQGGEGHGKIFTEINITPLTDIFLVLLIIMMVIAPNFNNSDSQEITVPKIQAGQAVDATKSLKVEVVKTGQFFIGGEQIAESSLTDTIRSASAGLEEKHIVVKADEATPSSVVMKVFEAARDAGLEKLTIAGEPLSKERSQTLKQSSSELDRPSRMLPEEGAELEVPR